MKRYIPCIAIACALTAAAVDSQLEILIENGSNIYRHGEMVELPAESIRGLIDSKYCFITDCVGKELPSQFTYDGKLIFRTDVPAESNAVYRIVASDTLRSYPITNAGRVYPERADDLAWENELVGFRVYGPSTQRWGERAFGYDIFLKHPTEQLIVPLLYAAQTSGSNWAKVDSLRAINPALAEEFIQSFTYHADHGLGMDCYAVGPTLGDGVAALLDNGKICYPWCYSQVEILDNGPIRFTVRLDFAPVRVGIDSVTEHRIISLDAGVHLNKCVVWYDGLSGNRDIVVGVPRRDDSEAVMDTINRVIAYADPTQGPDNGKAMTGIILDGKITDMTESEGHILARTAIAPDDTLRYYWGFAWDRADFPDFKSWADYLIKRSQALRTPLRVTVK